MAVGARDTSNLRVVVGIPILILVVLLLILVAYLYWKIRNKDREIQKLTEDEIHEFTHGDPESGNSALFYPYNTDFEIPKSKIQFGKSKSQASFLYKLSYLITF